MLKTPRKLPGYPVKSAFSSFKSILRDSRALALEAPTGSGKTTLLPILMLDAGLSSKRILLTQPRRLAAKSVAARISQLLGSPLGELAGYRVRGESKVSAATRIEVVTEGYALRLLQADPFLSDYDWLILDEFHERHIEGDLLIAFLRDLRRSVGPEEAPGIVVMTATWQGQGREALDEFSFQRIEGRMFPVEKRFFNGNPDASPEKKLATAVLQAMGETTGKILVFLPGRSELENALRILSEAHPDADVSLLYGGMELGNQQKVLLHNGPNRQIILATSIAETSLTIEGVTAVVDSGLQRLPVFQPGAGITRLVTRRLSRATSDQRAGRAGRLSPGIYYRLWSKSEDLELIERWDPEILTGDLSSARLQAALWDSPELPWVSPPPDGLWAQAEELLRQLDALDEDGRITERGRVLASLPLSPRLGHMAAAAPNSIDAALVAAVLSEGYRFRQDHLSFSERIHDARSRKDLSPIRKEADEILRQIRKTCTPQDSAPAPALSTGALLSLAYPDRIGRRTGPGRFELVSGAGLKCRTCDSEWAVFPEISGPKERQFGRLAEEVSFDDISSLHPQMLTVKREVTYLPDTGGFKVVRREVLEKLEIKTLPADKASREEKIEALKTAIKKRGPEVLRLDKSSHRLLGKLKTAFGAGITDLPSGDIKTLADSIEDWLAPWMDEELKPKVLLNALEARLDWQQKSKLDSIFPRQLVLRPGQKKDVDYSNPQQPLIRGRIQEFYGLASPLTIAEGKIQLAVELLSPAMRPLQTTSDLGKFWTGSWVQIRSEMRGRYPKHFWPEDPATAEPSLATGKGRPD
ncbi:MAG: ATP-dependent helicase HrpB [Spirochaetales bacterium]|nr:ATP-dependent helicase HrpB [Spirochaetales bacterium]